MTKFWYMIMGDGYSPKWRKGEAYDMEVLAEQVAEDVYCDDPSDPNDFELEVQISNDCKSIVKTFKVIAEISINYYPTEVIPDKG